MKRVCVLLYLALVTGGSLGANTFTKITTGNIVTDGGFSAGVAWGDYDKDGDLDLFVSNTAGLNNSLYHNNGDGTFTGITTGSVVNDGGNSTGCAWGDYDNDGFPDLFVANDLGGNFLYHNNGDGTFTKITTGSIVTDVGHSYGCAWGDYDNDGYLDLYVAVLLGPNFFYHNNGNGTFSRITAGAPATDIADAVGCAWGDYDHDGWLDLFVANANNQNNALYHNNGDGTFTAITTGAIVNDGGDSINCSWGDYDNDGFLDLYVGNRRQPNFLYHNNGDGTFAKVTTGSIATDIIDSWGCSWGDYDNDGDLDLFVTDRVGQSNILYQNNGDGTFTKIATGNVVTDTGESIGCGWGDCNGDGQLDLFVANWSGQNNFLYRNDGNEKSWITIQCVGSVSNRDGIGARLKVDATIGGSLRSQVRQIASGNGWDGSATSAHFGLGNATVISSLRLEWPSGVVQAFNNVAINQILTVTEPPSAQSSVIAPNQYADVDAPNSHGINFTLSNLRIQQVYGAAHFPKGPITITELRFRRDALQTPFASVVTNVQIHLSTSLHSPDNLSPTFANNIGADDTVVFSGTLAINSTGTGAVGAPNPFDIIVPLRSPFTYNPALGNLLLEIWNFSGSTARPVDASPDPNDSASRLYNLNTSINSPTGFADTGADIIQFVYSPVTSESSLVVPNGFANVEDDGYSGDLGGVIRMQEVYASSHFPAGAIAIKEIRFRRDAGTNPVVTVIPNLQINLSTTSKAPGALSSLFADNLGPDDAIVFSGALNISSLGSGPAGGPNTFDIVIPLATPFIYDPAAGNLLVDLRNFSGSTSSPLPYTDASNDFGDRASRAFSQDVNSPIADRSLDTGADILELVYSPAIVQPVSPAIVTQPQNQTASVGNSVSFSVVASGTAPMNYQWRANNVDISSATNITFSLPSVQPADAGNYSVRVSNSVGSVISIDAKLTVNPPSVGFPALSISDASVKEGNSGTVGMTFTVTLSKATAYFVFVDFATQNGSANDRQDYLAVSHTQIIFPPGSISKAITVKVLGDTAPEPNETFLVRLSNASRGATIAKAIGIGTILDDDTPLLNPRLVRVHDAAGSPGSVVLVPIELTAQGDENAIGFSLSFDPALLIFASAIPSAGGVSVFNFNVNTNEAGNGRIGLALAQPSGGKFAAGVQQLAVARFTVAGGAAATSTTIEITDQPVAREIADTVANPLPAIYQAGAVTLTAGGYEADVAPRPNGNNNGSVTIADWVQVGRFAAGLDTPGTPAEFQRADCAPRRGNDSLVLGNGNLTVADWVQAGRYAAGLDPITPAGGPTGPNPSPSRLDNSRGSVTTMSAVNRTVRLIASSVQAGQQATVAVEFNAQGNENAVGFSLSFDPSRLNFIDATAGTDANGTTFNLNVNQAATGNIGIALALPSGLTFSAGTKAIVQLAFTALANASGKAALAFVDTPIAREISDAAANTLNAAFPSGSITIQAAPAQMANSSISGDNTDSDHADGTNAEEFLVGTDASALKLVVRSAPLLSWSSVPNQIYRVLRKDSVISTNWISLATVMATNSLSTYVDLDSASGVGFYRIEVAP